MSCLWTEILQNHSIDDPSILPLQGFTFFYYKYGVQSYVWHVLCKELYCITNILSCQSHLVKRFFPHDIISYILKRYERSISSDSCQSNSRLDSRLYIEIIPFYLKLARRLINIQKRREKLTVQFIIRIRWGIHVHSRWWFLVTVWAGPLL